MKNKVLPKNSEELSEYLGDVEGLAEDLKNGDFKNVITNYVKTEREEITAQVKEQLQLGLAEMVGVEAKNAPVDLSNGMPKFAGAKSDYTVYNKNALGVQVNGKFADTAEFCRAVAGQSTNFRDHDELKNKLEDVRRIQNSFGSEVPDAGGFLIPEEFRSELLMYALEQTVVRQRATVIPMSTLRTYIPIVDDTSHVNNVFGGVQFYWTEESQPGTESQATFGRIALDVKKLMGYFEVPNELLADAPGFTAFFNQKVPQALAWAEDVAFFTGTGTGEPMGFINNNATVTVNARAGQSSGTIIWENVVDMYSRMLPPALNNAVWICSPDTLPQLYTMALSVGTGGGPVFLGSGMGGVGNSGSNAPPMTLLGRPLIISEKAPALGSQGCLNFVDLSYYLIGDRQAMELRVSDQFKFSTDKTAFKMIERVDGRPWIQSAVTPHNNSSNTLSPYVQLAAI